MFGKKVLSIFGLLLVGSKISSVYAGGCQFQSVNKNSCNLTPNTCYENEKGQYFVVENKLVNNVATVTPVYDVGLHKDGILIKVNENGRDCQLVNTNYVGYYKSINSEGNGSINIVQKKVRLTADEYSQQYQASLDEGLQYIDLVQLHIVQDGKTSGSPGELYSNQGIFTLEIENSAITPTPTSGIATYQKDDSTIEYYSFRVYEGSIFKEVDFPLESELVVIKIDKTSITKSPLRDQNTLYLVNDSWGNPMVVEWNVIYDDGTDVIYGQIEPELDLAQNIYLVKEMGNGLISIGGNIMNLAIGNIGNIEEYPDEGIDYCLTQDSRLIDVAKGYCEGDCVLKHCKREKIKKDEEYITTEAIDCGVAVEVTTIRTRNPETCNPSDPQFKDQCLKGYYLMNGGENYDDNSQLIIRSFVETDQIGTLWECTNNSGECYPVTASKIPYGYLKNEYVLTEAPYIMCYGEDVNRSCRAMLATDIINRTTKNGEDPICTEKGQLGLLRLGGETADDKKKYYLSTYFFCNDGLNAIPLIPRTTASEYNGVYFIGYDANAKENAIAYNNNLSNTGVYHNVFEAKMLREMVGDTLQEKDFYFVVLSQNPNVVLPGLNTFGPEEKYLYTSKPDMKVIPVTKNSEPNPEFIEGICVSCNNFIEMERDKKGSDTADYYDMHVEKETDLIGPLKTVDQCTDQP